MFNTFDIDSIQRLLGSLKIPQAGIAYVNAALASPARNVQGGGGNRVGYINCPKMCCEIQVESYHAEWRAALHHIFNDNDLGYLSQAPKLDICYLSKTGRRVRTQTTPDFIVFRRDCITLEEWKTSRNFEKLLRDCGGRYAIDANGRPFSKCGQESAEALGMRYEVCLDTDIPQITSANHSYLKSYLTGRAQSQYAASASIFSEIFREKSFVTAEEILTNKGATRDLLNFCLAQGIATFQIDQVELSKQANFMVFRDAIALEAFQKFSSSARKAARFPSLTTGMAVALDGKQLTVAHAGETQISFLDAQKSIASFPITWLHEQFQLGLFESLDASDAESSNCEALRHASTADISIALARLAAVEGSAAGHSAHSGAMEFSTRTLRRWQKQVRDTPGSRGEKLIALLPRIKSRGNRAPRMSAPLETLTNEMIDAHLRNPSRPSILQTYLSYETNCGLRGLTPIAMTSFYDRLHARKTISSINKSQGHKVAAAEAPAVWQLSTENFSHGQFPLEEVHVDHTLLDVEIRSALTGALIGRPWLTLAMDGGTRRVLAMYLSMLPPSAYSLIMVLTRLLDRFGRRPDRLIHDWGKEFQSNHAARVRDLLSFDILMRPKSMPRFGAILERMFGSATTQIIHNLIGNTKATKVPRTVTRGTDPKAFAQHTLLSLHHVLETFFFEEYDARPHSALLVSPKEYFESRLRETGNRPHQLVRTADYIPHIYPHTRGGTRSLNSRTGLWVNYDYYGHEKLTKLADNGRSLETKFNPLDPSSVYAFFEGEWLECRSRSYGELAKVPPIYRGYYFQEFLIAKKEQALGAHESRLRMADLVNQANVAVQTNAGFLETEFGKALWEHIDIYTPNASQLDEGRERTTPHGRDRIDALFANAIKRQVQGGGYGALAD